MDDFTTRRRVLNCFCGVCLSASFVTRERFSPLSVSGSFETDWTRTYGGVTVNDVVDTGGGYVLAGNTVNGEGERTDALLIAVDDDGAIRWKKSYDGGGLDYAQSVTTTSDGGYCFSGVRGSGGGSGGDPWIVQVDAGGAIQWDRTFDSEGLAVPSTILGTDDGGCFLAGHRATGSDWRRAWLVDLDADGEVQWERTLDTGTTDRVWSAVPAETRGYLLAGDTEGKGDERDAWVVKVNEEGALQWERSYGGDRDERALTVVGTADGGVCVAGETYSRASSGRDAWLLKADAEGRRQWDEVYDSGDLVASIATTGDGGYVLAGMSTDGETTSNDGWVATVAADRSVRSQRTYSGDGDDEFASVLAADDGGYLLAGTMEQDDAGTAGWLVKFGREPATESPTTSTTRSSPGTTSEAPRTTTTTIPGTGPESETTQGDDGTNGNPLPGPGIVGGMAALGAGVLLKWYSSHRGEDGEGE